MPGRKADPILAPATLVRIVLLRGLMLSVVMVIVVVGVLLWALNSFIPMDPKIKNILNVVVVIALVLWLLRAFGIL